MVNIKSKNGIKFVWILNASLLIGAAVGLASSDFLHGGSTYDWLTALVTFIMMFLVNAIVALFSSDFYENRNILFTILIKCIVAAVIMAACYGVVIGFKLFLEKAGIEVVLPVVIGVGMFIPGGIMAIVEKIKQHRTK